MGFNDVIEAYNAEGQNYFSDNNYRNYRFENTRKSNNVYRHSKKAYNYLIQNRDELIKVLGEEKYLALIKEHT